MSKKGAPRRNFDKNLWDTLVKEHSKEPIVVDVAGREITVQAPTGKTMRALRDAAETDDYEDVLYAVFDEDDADHIRDQWDEAPGPVLGEFLNGIMEEFGLVSEGNPQGSRN